MRAAVVQMQSKTGAVRENLERMAAYAREGASRGAELILFPELCATGYRADEAFSELAEPLEGRYVQALAEMSHSANDILIYTSVPERHPTEGQKPYNTGVLVDGTGWKAAYRKMHLWKAETAYFTPGREQVLADTPAGSAGLQICYDSCFPESARKLALSGAKLLLYSFAFANPARRYAFELVTGARALENGCYVLASNMTGREKDSEYLGASRIIDPQGRVLCAAQDAEGLIYADIAEEAVAEAREQYPYLRDRRQDCY